jgi:RNA polymerase sigma-70 factor (ECF subfamily)
MNQKTDEEIASQVQQSDTESFGILVERYESKITRYARKFLSHSQEIEDLVQEVFIKTYENIQSFNIKMKFSPWIYRIAHNEFVNALKKKGRLPLYFFDFDAVLPHPLAKETADGKTNEREIKNMLDKWLSKLRPKYREPLVLYYFEELNYQEIAEVLHIPVSTVGVRLNRGKDILKNILKNHE